MTPREQTRQAFIQYLADNPDMRLMQAVRNFCQVWYLARFKSITNLFVMFDWTEDGECPATGVDTFNLE